MFQIHHPSIFPKCIMSDKVYIEYKIQISKVHYFVSNSPSTNIAQAHYHVVKFISILKVALLRGKFYIKSHNIIVCHIRHPYLSPECIIT